MKVQFSISVEQEILDALRKLAEHEHRSLANMAGLLLTQKIDELRGEYRKTPDLPSLPKASRTTTRAWTKELQELYGD